MQIYHSMSISHKKTIRCWPKSLCNRLNSRDNSNSRKVLAFKAGPSLSVLGIARRRGWNLLTKISSTRVLQKRADETSKVLTKLKGRRQTHKERLQLGAGLSKHQSLTCSLKWTVLRKPSCSMSNASASLLQISRHWALRDLLTKALKKTKPKGCSR